MPRRFPAPFPALVASLRIGTWVREFGIAADAEPLPYASALGVSNGLAPGITRSFLGFDSTLAVRVAGAAYVAIQLRLSSQRIKMDDATAIAV